MAEDEKASRFLKKSKWGKLLKPKDKTEQQQPAADVHRQPTFTLNDDVTDFLKPSTEKQKPKLDVSIATRWPDAHDVRSAGVDAASPIPQPMGYTKPKRRKGLTVAFVKTLPEIIGEGGDDALEPPQEIGRIKAMVSRSVSDRRPGSVDQGQGQYPRSPPLPGVTKMPSPPMIQEDESFAPGPLRRAQTSHNEFSPAMQRKVANPVVEEQQQYQSSLSRAGTGYGSSRTRVEHIAQLDSSALGIDENVVPRSRDRPILIDPPAEPPRMESESTHPDPDTEQPNRIMPKQYLSLAPRDGASPMARKRREMVANEGAAFRRASMLMQQGQNDEDDSPPQSRDAQQFAPHYPPRLQPVTLQPEDERRTSDTAISPIGPNPFKDPNYIKRHSREVTPERIAPPTSIRQMAREQTQPLPQQPNMDQYRTRAGSQSRERPSSGERMPPPQSRHQRMPSHDRNYVGSENGSEERLPTRQVVQPLYASSQQIVVPEYPQQNFSRPPPSRDGSFNSSGPAPAMQPGTLYARPNGSSSSFQRIPPGMSHSRASSRDGVSPSMLHPTGSHPQQQSLSPQSPGFQNSMYSQASNESGSRTSLLPTGRGMASSGPSPNPRVSPDGYFTNARPPNQQVPRSAAANVREEDASRRPSSSSSAHAARPSDASPLPPERNNPAADAAFADFATRVAHMKGVFRLTAEKELPGDRCSPSMWLRSGLWWYSKGKAGLEGLLQLQNPNEPHRELLTQAHVDLAKAWWIFSDPLEAFNVPDEQSPQVSSVPPSPDLLLVQGVAALKSNLKTLSLSMGRNQLLPPTQSLIQGQDTRIWLEYPRFASEVAAVLSGNMSTGLMLDESISSVDPYELLPLSDTRTSFCYGRFSVDVSLNTEDPHTDRVVLPCILTVLRGRRDFQTSVAIASQNELVSIKIAPSRGDNKILTWADVSWRATANSMMIRLPRGFDVVVRMQERDFRAVWNLSEYARKVEKSLRPEPDEQLVHEARLAELQYVDTSNSNAFPPDKIRGCSALVFESTEQHADGNGMHRLHRGYRILLITDPGHKTLSSASHNVCKRAPLYFEFMTDSTANGTTAMVIRIQEEKRQCRMLLVFPDAQRRQALYDVLNGLSVGPDETVVGKMNLTSLQIEAAAQAEGFSQSSHPVLQALQWQKLGVTNGQSDDPNSRIPSTVDSDNLRVVARHATGCITDRMNLSKGELLLRLPVAESPSIQILRQPQEDITMSIDTRNSPQQVSEGIGQLLHSIVHQPTIRTFTFASQPDLHAFQAAITGFAVRYDGLASTLGISRRRMVVPIYKKWEASNVKLQLVVKDTVVQLMAFMEEFSHADALCFQVKSTDVFETIKGDTRHKKWGIKLVDAKFTLPAAKEKGEVDSEEMLRRRFVNLEGLEYAEEHDDITIEFLTELERDKFAQALPAATSVSRGITLKRRI